MKFLSTLVIEQVIIGFREKVQMMNLIFIMVFNTRSYFVIFWCFSDFVKFAFHDAILPKIIEILALVDSLGRKSLYETIVQLFIDYYCLFCVVFS